MRFNDDAIIEGIGPASRLALSFGLFYFDYDLDGHLDVLQANGHIENEINRVQSSQHYAQMPQLFWNCGPDCEASFVLVKSSLLGDLGKPLVGRGATYADIDADGDLDVLLTQPGDRPRLLRNDQETGHYWLRLRPGPDVPERLWYGSIIELAQKDRIQRRQVHPSRSYLSQVELPVTFGRGNSDHIERLTIRWPDRSQQEIPVQVNSVITVGRP